MHSQAMKSAAKGTEQHEHMPHLETWAGAGRGGCCRGLPAAGASWDLHGSGLRFECMLSLQEGQQVRCLPVCMLPPRESCAVGARCRCTALAHNKPLPNCLTNLSLHAGTSCCDTPCVLDDPVHAVMQAFMHLASEIPRLLASAALHNTTPTRHHGVLLPA